MSGDGVNGREAEKRRCKCCRRRLPIWEFEDEFGDSFRQCDRCRRRGRERERIKRTARIDGRGQWVEWTDPDVIVRLDQMGGGARANWTELAGLPGGFEVIPGRRRASDNGRVWWQIR